MPSRSFRSLAALFATAPFSDRLGLELLSARGGRAEVALTLGRPHMQGLARAHGGVLTALADTAATFAAYSVLEPGAALLTVSLTMNFLGGAEAGTRLVAKARLLRAGRRIVVSEVQVLDPQETMLASGLFTLTRTGIGAPHSRGTRLRG